MLENLTKVVIGIGLTFWAVGIGIGLYVGFSVIVLNKDFGGRGKVSGKRIERLEKIHNHLHRG